MSFEKEFFGILDYEVLDVQAWTEIECNGQVSMIKMKKPGQIKSAILKYLFGIIVIKEIKRKSLNKNEPMYQEINHYFRTK